ncbi:acyltransferase family protein [Aromatoleum evansii]|uniref:Acyltransferase family protein n=1 Tax=Aromatoleum evansii TaxID=59406 RepID=A0ABZ1AR02_AROEV|nr:acyltransferase family protein [Aromatoleum evansii]
MTHPNPHLAYRPDIDGLRALAVLSVVIFHAFPEALPGGFVGVDIFFVISGYLISSIIIKALGRGEFSFADFYARRVRRIFPALLVVVSACLAVGWGALFPDEYAQLAKHSVGGLGFVANFMFWQEAGYFDTEAELKPLLHLWSLGIEEQFYIVWPALALVVWRMRHRLGGIVVILAAISLVASIALSAQWPVASYFLPWTRVWELLFGAALAWRLQRYGMLFPVSAVWAPSIASVAGLLLIALGLVAIDKERVFPGAWALLPVCGAVLLIAAGPRAAVNRILLSARPAVWVGLISFPLYLWHWPLLSFIRILHPEGATPPVLLAALAAAFALSWATFRVVELPVRRHGGRRTVAGLVSAGALLAIVGWSINQRDGLEIRLKDAQAQQASAALRWEESWLGSGDCRHLLPANFTGDCLIGDASRAPDAVIIGDSHANHFFWGISEALARSGGNLLQINEDGCLLLLGMDTREKTGASRGCAPVAEIAFAYAVNAPEVKTIFLAGRWVLGITARQLKDKPGVFSRAHRKPVLLAAPDDPSIGRGNVVATALDETLRQLTATGKRVVFLDSVPELPFNARECVHWTPNRFVSRIPRPQCEVSRKMIDARNGEYRPYLRPVLEKYPEVIVFDPQTVMCDDRACLGWRDGELMYRDDDHLSMAGSRWLGAHIVRALQTAPNGAARPGS